MNVTGNSLLSTHNSILVGEADLSTSTLNITDTDSTLPGTYTLTVTDPTSGCFASDSVLVDLLPLPAAVTGLKVVKSGDNSYQVTSTRDGKTVNVTDYTIDGDTMHVVSSNELSGSTVTYDAKRS